jgi:lysophospholipase L1-like esterase
MKLPLFVVPAWSALVVTASALAADPVAAASWKFDFGTGPVAPGYVQVTPASLFSTAAGFGFEPGADLVAVDRGGADALHRDYLLGAKPCFFSVAVPEGNYNVTVHLGDAQAEAVATVKAESRRLMIERMDAAPGKFATRTFTVNVRNSRLPPPPANAPGGAAVLLNEREKDSRTWDDKLTLEFNGAAPKIGGLEIEKVECPTVFLAGDSTVTDQAQEPGASWGQMLPRFLKPGIAVANYAESGETLKSFSNELRLAKLLSEMKAGDWLLIQFGHNDEKAQWPQTYVEAHTTYKAYLKAYIAEARLRGANPVLVTSMQRRTFDDTGHIKNSHGDYPAAMREVATEEKVPLVDLELASVRLYEALGPEKAPALFSRDGQDPTHHNNYGAYELAKCVVQALRDARVPLAQFIVDDFAGFDPTKPDALEFFSVPPSPGRSEVAPRGN